MNGWRKAAVASLAAGFADAPDPCPQRGKLFLDSLVAAIEMVDATDLRLLVGGWFLVRQYLPRFDVGAYWPFVVIVLGAVLIVTALRPGGRSAD